MDLGSVVDRLRSVPLTTVLAVVAMMVTGLVVPNINRPQQPYDVRGP